MGGTGSEDGTLPPGGTTEAQGLEDTYRPDSDAPPPSSDRTRTRQGDDTLPSGPRLDGAPGSSEIFPPVVPDTYHLGDEIARGGLGRIMEGYDNRLRRSVALKELISGDSKAELRFEREALITARLQHPNIIAVHEAGSWNSGKRFYAMKLVKGKTLTQALEDADTQEKRLDLLPHLIDVAEAVAYAHNPSILHGGLKPANVMVVPFGETVVIDWGLAKDLLNPDEGISQDIGGQIINVDFANHSIEGTSDGIVVGTPPYMAPEQARAEELDGRADVYALGAMLYHVLSGQRPYQEVPPHEILVAVVSGPPESIELLAPDAPPELIAIIEKAMARNPDSRYPSAEEMAQELRRYSTGQLVGAHEYSAWDMLERFIMRHRAAVTVATFALAVLLGFGAWSFREISEERNEAQKQATLAQKQVNQLLLQRARTLLASDPTRAAASLKELSEYIPGAASVAAEAEGLGIAKHIYTGHGGDVEEVAFSPNGQWLASAGRDQRVKVRKVDTQEVITLQGHRGRVSCMQFISNDELVTGSYDGTIRLWKLSTGKFVSYAGHSEAVKNLIVWPDGKTMASIAKDRTLRVWNLSDGTSKEYPFQTINRGTNLALLGNQHSLVTGGHGNSLRLWDIRTGQSELLPLGSQELLWFEVSPDNHYLAAGGKDGETYLYDIQTRETHTLVGHEGGVTRLAFSPDGSHLATVSSDHTVRLWDLKSGEFTSREVNRHQERVLRVEFSPDGKWLASGAWDQTIGMYHLDSREHRVFKGHSNVVSALSFSKNGKLLASGSWDSTVRLWPVPEFSHRVFEGHAIGVHTVAFSPDGRRLASGGHDNTVRAWALDGGANKVFRGHQNHVFRVRFSPDSKYIASSSDDRTVRLWQVDKGPEDARIFRGHGADVEEIEFSPDGRWLASVGKEPSVWLWPVKGKQEPRVFQGHLASVSSVDFSPDSSAFVTGGRDGTARIYRIQGPETILKGHRQSVEDALFSPDGSQIATASLDGSVRLWDPDSGRQLIVFDELPNAHRLAFSPNGKRLAVASSGSGLWLCSLAFRYCDFLKGHSAEVETLVFDARGDALITGSADNTIRIYDLDTFESIVLRGHRSPVFEVALSPDGAWLASGSSDFSVRLWRMQRPPRPGELEKWLQSRTSVELR